MKNGIPLRKFMDQFVEKWTCEFKEEALNGKVEGMVFYAKMLMNGREVVGPDVDQAVFWLQKACFDSAEASFLLGKLYSKGKKVSKDEEKAYFYYRLASSFKCKCGTMAYEYHSYQITNVHVCFPFEASSKLKSFKLSNIENLEARYMQWISSIDL